MSMDGELAIGKLSETNLYFKLSPYLLLGRAPSEWFLPNNLIGNLISWLNSLTSNKYSFEYQYIGCFDGAVQYEYLHCISSTFQISVPQNYLVLVAFQYLEQLQSPSPSALCHLDCLSGGGKLPKMLCIFAVSGLPDLCLIYKFPPSPLSIRSFVMGVISTFLII